MSWEPKPDPPPSGAGYFVIGGVLIGLACCIAFQTGRTSVWTLVLLGIGIATLVMGHQDRTRQPPQGP